MWNASLAAARLWLQMPVHLSHLFCRICSSCRMDPVGRRLKQLDSESADLAAKVEAACIAFMSATNFQQKTELRERYEKLEKEEEDCESERRDLQLKLPSSGEHIAQTAFARLPLLALAYPQCRLEVQGNCAPKSYLAAESPGHMDETHTSYR